MPFLERRIDSSPHAVAVAPPYREDQFIFDDFRGKPSGAQSQVLPDLPAAEPAITNFNRFHPAGRVALDHPEVGNLFLPPQRFL